MPPAKQLQDMTLQELWQLFPIELSDHNAAWRVWADEEIESLSSLLAEFSPEINHIGSTAIPSIKTKPVVDILVETGNTIPMKKLRNILESAGYICMAESYNRMSFNKGYTLYGYAERVFHIHIRRTGDNDEIAFRDFLNANPDTAKEYEALKISLLPKYRNNRDGYTSGKTEFVKNVMERIRSRNHSKGEGISNKNC